MANIPAFQASDASSILAARTRIDKSTGISGAFRILKIVKKIIFIGQAPARPSSRHEVPGTYLHKWLKQIGMSEAIIAESCLFYALTDVFPGSARGGHAVPSKENIEAHLPVVRQVIKETQPDLVVPVGQMAISYVIGSEEKLVNVIGKIYNVDPLASLGRPTACIPLPHPSGRSVWNITHKELVSQALALLKNELDRPGEAR